MNQVKKQILWSFIACFFAYSNLYALTLKNMNDQPVLFETIIDSKPTMVHFWASWCKSCMEELPSFITFMQTHASDRYNIIAISLDHKSVEQMNLYIKNNYPNFKTYYDQKFELFRSFEQSSIPYTAILDKDKIIFELTRSVDWQNPKTKDTLLSLLKREK